jgi:signal peptidase I
MTPDWRTTQGEPMAQTSTLGTRLTAVLMGAGALVTTLCAGLVVTTHVHGSAVLSGSMRPAFAPGDAVLTRNVPVSEVRPGMIIEVTPPGHTVPFAHRVVTVTGDPAHPTITTKGDANPLPDSWKVTLSTPTVPRVVGSLPALGWVVNAPQQPRDRAFLFALLGLMTTLFGARMFLGAFLSDSQLAADAAA